MITTSPYGDVIGSVCLTCAELNGRSSSNFFNRYRPCLKIRDCVLSVEAHKPHCLRYDDSVSPYLDHSTSHIVCSAILSLFIDR